MMTTGLVFQNALTLASTDLLFATGSLAVIVMHCQPSSASVQQGVRPLAQGGRTSDEHIYTTRAHAGARKAAHRVRDPPRGSRERAPRARPFGKGRPAAAHCIYVILLVAMVYGPVPTLLLC